MHIKIDFDCDTAAFNPGTLAHVDETQRILRHMADKIERWLPSVMLDDHEGYGSMTMAITDKKGETIGTITLSDGNPTDPEL